MKSFAWLVAAGLLVGAAGVAQAETPAEWKDCDKEISKYCKGAADSHAIFECIEGREKKGKKSGLSKACYAAHEKMESSEQEKGEKHERKETH